MGLSAGGYHVFTKMAAGKISDIAGGFWLETTALVGMGLFMLLTRQVPWGEGASVTRAGLLFSVAGGVCVALAHCYAVAVRSRGVTRVLLRG